MPSVPFFCCLPFLSFSLFPNRSKLQPPCWSILKMIIHWDWGFCSWTRPWEPHHPCCNRQEQKEWRGERQEFHWATTKNTVKSSTPPHSHHTVYCNRSTCRERSSILISPWERDTLSHIDHSLLTDVANSLTSVNQKFISLLLPSVSCPPPTLVWHRCCPSPPPPAKSNI